MNLCLVPLHVDEVDVAILSVCVEVVVEVSVVDHDPARLQEASSQYPG